MSENNRYYIINGQKDGERVDSRVLEERLQKAIENGHRHIKIIAYGQHGMGGRLYKSEGAPIYIRIEGHPGQRTGSMGFPGTFIELDGPASDDAGWLNAGAEIIIRGNAANGTANAMAQGKIFVRGNIGARGMTMTKENPRFAPPELWVLGSVGDYFGEFMAGGIAVICGHKPQNPDNLLGYRPFVGMVGGKVFFRGPHQGYSQADAKLTPINDEDWGWLEENLAVYLEKINKSELYDRFLDRKDWQLITARTPQERKAVPGISMSVFRKETWNKELGLNGLVGDLLTTDQSPVPLVTTGDLRRYAPVWENDIYMAPCQSACPAGIPVQKRWQMIREGRMDEAVDLALAYTPFPAAICGYLCPNLCMQGCTRQSAFMPSVDISILGRASIDAKTPELPLESGRQIAVIGGGPAGLSAAWQLRRAGHRAVVYDTEPTLGGKMQAVIPESRIPAEVLSAEVKRMQKVIPHIHLQQPIDRQEFIRMKTDFDYVIIAAGAQKPRILPVPGHEMAMTALDFLKHARSGNFHPGRQVVVIGAGNVGCDVAAEAHRLGSEDLTLIDIQKPASFGKERAHAEAAGAKFLWPRFVKKITHKGVDLNNGEFLPADTVVISIGDEPDIDFLPENIALDKGFIRVNEHYQTTDHRVFAVGDAVRPGLLTDAVGAGRTAAATIAEMLTGKRPNADTRGSIDKNRVTLAYFDPRITLFDDANQCGEQCASCGSCRDCGICVNICPQTAITRNDAGEGYEYVVDGERCIGCGFCAQVCPCGVWNLVENDPLE